MPTIRQNLTLVNYYPRGTKPTWIVIHNTANSTSREGTAYNNTVYFHNINRQASAHYFIDDGDTIWQCVKDTDSAWAVGDADSRNGCTNFNSISIEVCETESGEFTQKEIKTLKWLVLYLMAKYNIPSSRVCRHYDVTRKSCPRYYVNNGRWNALKTAITTNAEQKPGKPVNDVGMYYRVHAQNLGWLPPVHDGQTAGTTGCALRVEAIKMTPPEGVSLDIEVHLQGIGWKVYKGVKRGSYDPVMGTEGESRRVEAVRIHVTENRTGKSLRYRAHVQGIGWQGWCNDGDTAGTEGQSKRLEAIQIEFI